MKNNKTSRYGNGAYNLSNVNKVLKVKDHTVVAVTVQGAGVGGCLGTG